MSKHHGNKGPCPEAQKPRKKPRREEIARQITLAKQRPFAALRAFREQQEKARADSKQEVV
jgi:hypothetical protein